MPSVASGSNYADMRLLPFTVALALLAIATNDAALRTVMTLSWLGAMFFGARIAAATVSFALYDASFTDQLQAIDHIPAGTAVLVLDRRECVDAPIGTRFDHLGSIAIVRRDAFVNDQWTLDGAQLMRVIKSGVGEYGIDPSQHVTDAACGPSGYGAFDTAIARFNRTAFDFVWTLGFPPGRARAADMSLIWGNGASALYRVVKHRGDW